MRINVLALLLAFLSITTAQAAYVRWTHPERSVAAAADRFISRGHARPGPCSLPGLGDKPEALVSLLLCSGNSRKR